jgi:aarF domain-containing kinase
LDTGLFHADPHPGNLIRTPDGKLAILDFGEDFSFFVPVP